MGPKTKELIDVLEALIFTLECDSETFWCDRIRKACSRLLESDYSGIEYLLDGYGGMGSFNDLVLGQSIKDGVLVWTPSAIELNEKLQVMRNQAWELASAIKRSQ